MTFTVEVSKSGKDSIVYHNYKFRESNSKNEDIVWLYLGKNWNSSIRTESKKTNIYLAKVTHTGHYPVPCGS